MMLKGIRVSYGGRAAIISFHVLKQHLRHHHSRISVLSNNNGNKHRASKRSRSNSASPSSSSAAASVHKSSSLSVKTHHDVIKNPPPLCKNIPSKSSSSSQPPSLPMENTAVGILGGFSVFSTLIFLEKLVWCSTRDGYEKGSVSFVVCSEPSLYRELIRPHETITTCSSECAHKNHIQIVENLRRKLVFLEESGAGCIVIPCNLSHTWFKEISGRCSLTVLHMGECAAKELKEAKLKPIEAGSNLRIGVIATDEVLKAGVYQDELQKQGFEVVLPDRQTMEQIVIPAIHALRRKDMEGAQNLLRIAIQILLVRAVNTVILASDELQALLPPDDPLLRRCLDPMDALARSTVKWARSVKTYKKNSINGA